MNTYRLRVIIDNADTNACLDHVFILVEAKHADEAAAMVTMHLEDRFPLDR